MTAHEGGGSAPAPRFCVICRRRLWTPAEPTGCFPQSVECGHIGLYLAQVAVDTYFGPGSFARAHSVEPRSIFGGGRAP